MTDTLQSPWDDHIMAPAFWGFVHYMASEQMASFEDENHPLRIANDALGQMIDRATGLDLSEAQRFVDWCVTQYGRPEDMMSDEEIEREMAEDGGE